MTVDRMINPAQAVYAKGTSGLPTPVDDQGNGLPTQIISSGGTALDFNETIIPSGSPWTAASPISPLFDISCAGYGTLTIETTGSYTNLVFNVQVSMDGTDYRTIANGQPYSQTNATIPNVFSGSTGQTPYHFNVAGFLKVKVNVTQNNAAVTFKATLSRQVWPYSIYATAVGAAAHDAAITGNPVRLAGRALTPGTPYTAVAAGDVADLVTDLTGAVLVAPQYSFNRITSNTTTTVKSGAGIFAGIVVTKAGASANTMTIYDNTAGSGTVIAVIDTTALVVGSIIDFKGLVFGTGLTFVTATGTAAEFTVLYR